MQAPINSASASEIGRSTSAPDASSLKSHIGELSRPISISSHSQHIISSQSKTKALQLGANKIPASISYGALADEIAEEESASASIEGNPWGADLIDVNADDDDWSKFEILYSVFLLLIDSSPLKVRLRLHPHLKSRRCLKLLALTPSILHYQDWMRFHNL